MKVFTGISGWLCLSALLSSFKTGEAVDSLARCSLSFSADSTSQSVILAAEAGGVAQASAQAIAEATATAAAVAVARASARCYSEGRGNFILNGRSLAQAHAFAYAEAFAMGIVEAEVCDKCSASAVLVAESWSKLFLEAVASAEIKLSGSGTAEINADIFVKAVAEAVVTAYAAVLVDARAGDDGCFGSISGTAGSGDVTDPDVASCVVNVAGIDAAYAQDAVAAAAVVVSNIACGDAPRQIDDVSQAYATAIAQAIAEVTLDCEIAGNGFACALGDADVVSVAKATATAIAVAVVEASLLDTACKCELAIEVIVQATETIISQAAASAWAEVCSGESFFEQDLTIRIQGKIASAFAGVWVQIFEGCSVVIPDIVAGVSTCKSCVDYRRICYAGNTADIKGCCSSAHKCIQRTSSVGFCVDPQTVPGHWQGGELACTSDN